MKNKIKGKCSASVIFMVLVLLPALHGCTVTRSAFCSLRSTGHFSPLETDYRVLYEEGAETFAEEMARLLPEAIKQIESGHYRPFAETVNIHVCASQESYTKLTGLKAPASMTLKGVFFSPRLIEEQRPLSLYLAHELSHLHLRQQIGIYKYGKLPAWFKEGLATFVSGGGGAHKVTEAEAMESIKAGSHFQPHEKGGIFSSKYADHWGLSNHMFYRQSMMFVAFLKGADESGYRDFLIKIQDGESFSDSFCQTFDSELSDMWTNFVREINSRARES